MTSFVDNHVNLENFVSPVMEGVQLSNLDRKYMVLL